MRSPQPPLNKENETLKRSITEEMNYRNYLFQNGVKMPLFTQQQINALTSRSFLGNLVYNTTTNSAMYAYLNTGTNTIEWRAF